MQIKKIFQVILFMLFLMTSCQNVFGFKKTITHYIDLTGDGETEKITLDVKAKDFNSPFIWKLTIFYKGNTIYSYESDDTEIDKLFNNRGYANDYNSYKESKEQWYFKDFLNHIVLPRDSYSVEGILDKNYRFTLYPLGTKYLSEHGITGDKATLILNKMANLLQTGKAIVITIPAKPNMFYGTMMFCPETNSFMTIYEE